MFCVAVDLILAVVYLVFWLRERKIRRESVQAQVLNKHFTNISAIEEFERSLMVDPNLLVGYSRAFNIQSDSVAMEKSLMVDLKFSNLSLALEGGKKTILRGVSGQIRSGRVTAIMGPSGAGSKPNRTI